MAQQPRGILMNKHYSEVDLLESHYLKPCMNTEVMAHLDSCAECADRYARLEEKLRSAAVEKNVEKPETFWARQKLSIVRRAEERRAKHISTARTLRVAAAAVLAFFLGGVVVYEAVEPGLNAPVEKHTATMATAATTESKVKTADSKVKTEDVQSVRDPWQSDELTEFHDMVKWESWVETKNGGQS